MRQFTFDHSNIYVLVAGRNSKTAVESGRRMVVTGHISQMRHFYNACDVVVGTGRVALESLACGVPTIAVGSKRFMGLVTPSNLSRTLQYNFGDHASHNRPWSDTQLSHALLHVLENRESVQRQTSSLRTVLLGDFSVRHMAKMVIRVYQQAKGH
jgi:glycosyltransferase involved in cell wall biosynthesis